MSGPVLSSVANTFFTSSTVVSVTATTLTGSQTVTTIPSSETVAVYRNADTTLTATEVATADGGWAVIDGTTIFVGQAALTLSDGAVLSLATGGLVNSGTTVLWSVVDATATGVNTSLLPVGTVPITTSATLSSYSQPIESQSTSATTTISYNQPIETQTLSTSTVSSSSVSYDQPIESQTSSASSTGTAPVSYSQPIESQSTSISTSTTVEPTGPVVITTGITTSVGPSGPVIVSTTETVNPSQYTTMTTYVPGTTSSASHTPSASPTLVNGANSMSAGKAFTYMGALAAFVGFML